MGKVTMYNDKTIKHCLCFALDCLIIRKKKRNVFFNFIDITETRQNSGFIYDRFHDNNSNV